MGSKRLNIALKIVFGVAFAVALFAMSWSSYTAADTYRHAALGKEFLRDLGFPKQDNFSFAGPVAWDRSTWLFDFFLYSLFYIAGPANLFYLKLFLYAVFAGVLFLIMFKKQQGRYLTMTIPVGMLCMLLLDGYFRATPSVFSYVFTIYFIFVLEQEPTKRNAYLYYSLPFISLFWANMDATVPAATIITLAYLLYYVVDAYEMPEKRERYDSPAILIAAAGVAAASLLSPALFGPYTGLSNGFKNGLDTWSTMLLKGNPAEKLRLVLFLVYMLAAVIILFFNERGADPGRKTELVKDLGIVAALLALSYADTRYIPLFIVATTPLIMYYAYLIFRWSIVWPLQWTEKHMTRVKNITYLALIPLTLLFAYSRLIAPEKKDIPSAAFNFITAEKAEPNIITQQQWTGAAEYALYPNYKVMWDANPARPRDLKKEYSDAEGSSVTMTPALIKYGINTILAKPGSILADKAASSGYKPAYFDNDSVVLVNPEKSQAYFKFINPLSKDDFYDVKNYDAAVAELSAFAEKYPSIGAHSMLARLYAVKDPKKAKTYLENTIADFEDEYPLYDQLGRIYYEEGEFESAVDIWEQAKELDPATKRLISMAKHRMEKEEE